MKQKVKFKTQYCLVTVILISITIGLQAQKKIPSTPVEDSVPTQKKDNLFGKIAKVISKDSSENELIYSEDPVRNDLAFKKYSNKRIRNIYIEQKPFGKPIYDSAGRVDNFFIRAAQQLHTGTKTQVIKNNLFFRENDLVIPYLLADNERYLRDLPYLQDARIIVHKVRGNPSWVDVYVITKDVFSIGGEASIFSKNSFDISVTDQNFKGTGNAIEGGFFYDANRAVPLAFKADYLQRNIHGSFINVFGGINTYFPSYSNGKKESEKIYAGAQKPLVSTYDKWTYSFEFEYHHNKNHYAADSLFKEDLRYQYNIFDVWGGRLMNFQKLKDYSKDNRWRTFAGLRLLSQNFTESPEKFSNSYYYKYAGMKAALLSFSIFKQDFYRTHHIYGFGRSEDVPEGNDVSIIAGYTSKEHRQRSYFGVDFRRNYFSAKKNYLDFTARYGSFLYGDRFEDIATLFNLNFISKLNKLNETWQQRYFLSASITNTFRDVLNQPLFLESEYGIPDMDNGNIEADMRISASTESVFFNNVWNLAGFKFAPLAAVGFSILKPVNESLNKSDLFTVLSAGLRVRNESLIFGTLEARVNYFPRVNEGSSLGFSIKTNMRFKYNSNYVRKPDFIALN